MSIIVLCESFKRYLLRKFPEKKWIDRIFINELTHVLIKCMTRRTENYYEPKVKEKV